MVRFNAASPCGNKRGGLHLVISKHASPTPGSRHFEPCLATAQELHRGPATTNTTAPAPEQRNTNKLGLYAGRARPARTHTKILIGSTCTSTTLTAADIRRTSTVTAEATHEMAPDGAPRL